MAANPTDGLTITKRMVDETGKHKLPKATLRMFEEKKLGCGFLDRLWIKSKRVTLIL
jgi:hypothetical protein